MYHKLKIRSRGKEWTRRKGQQRDGSSGAFLEPCVSVHVLCDVTHASLPGGHVPRRSWRNVAEKASTYIEDAQECQRSESRSGCPCGKIGFRYTLRYLSLRCCCAHIPSDTCVLCDGCSLSVRNLRHTSCSKLNLQTCLQLCD